MNYTPSVNIGYDVGDNFKYIATPNAQSVAAKIIDGFNSGNHTFSIIGTYGTGKSSFLMALERDLHGKSQFLIRNPKVFQNCSAFEFLKIVGDYAPLSQLLSDALNTADSDGPRDILSTLSEYQKKLKSQGKFLFIIVDEFGKTLEYAANNNPEKELYFLQKLSEWVNIPTRNAIWLTTLHQNFGAYASKLSETRRNEWVKIKGRFKELVFSEPIEQLLYLAASNINTQTRISGTQTRAGEKIYHLCKKYGAISSGLDFMTTQKLFPLDALSAAALTMAIQRYGQNERTLFSFLADQSDLGLRFKTSVSTGFYHLASVYDYITYSFYSTLSQGNNDSTNWRAMHTAIERIESGIINDNLIEECLSVAKTIGMLNLFFPGIRVDEEFLSTYLYQAIGLRFPQNLISALLKAKIIRFAAYKNQYILFEGTDIDIEDELYKASAIVPVPNLTIEEIGPHIRENVILASANYSRTGTPRYFKLVSSNTPIKETPTGDIDGYINVIFPLGPIEEDVKLISQVSPKPILYAIFKETEPLVKTLHEIKKLQYLIENVVLDDRIATAEVEKQLEYEQDNLNSKLNDFIADSTNNILWFFNGEELRINSERDLNKTISMIADRIYYATPIVKNELFNKQKLSSAISLARVNLLDAMLANSDKEDFGFAKTAFPPEKTIYYTLLKSTGIHRNIEGAWVLSSPTNPGIESLWSVCNSFLAQTSDRARKLTELSKILSSAPFKLKQGLIDFWIPIFLFVKQQEFALYHKGSFILNINKEVFELLQKHLGDFSVRTFVFEGQSLDIFNRYREFLRKGDASTITTATLIETIKPFFHFYKGLNTYAKNTRKFDNPATAQFRDILASAQDPAKAFLEDIPVAMGYREAHGQEFAESYLGLLRASVHELVVCYDQFIDRIEKAVIDHLGLEGDFYQYKEALSTRYSKINARLLSQKCHSFLDRILSPSQDKKEFYEKIGLVVFDKKIESISDKDEDLFISTLLHLFSELERYTSINDMNSTDEVAYSFELASSNGSFSASKTYRLPKKKAKCIPKIETKIAQHLSGDTELDICVLLKMLNDRIK